MEQFEWTPGGRELLSTIEAYIESYGGNHALLKKVMDEDRAIRRKMYEGSYAAYVVKQRKKVRGYYNNRSFDFLNTTEAAHFLSTKPVCIRAAICQRFTHKGFLFEYVFD